MTAIPQLFLSYRRKDAAAVDLLVVALEQAGVKVWLDRNEIDRAADIQARIDAGLATSHALLAWFSADYPRSRACQWEITAALITARADSAPLHRVLAINPEADDSHIQPIAVRNIQHYPAPVSNDTEGMAEFARQIAAAIIPIAQTAGPFGALRRLARPPCHGFRALGSERFVGRVGDLWQIHDALARGDYAIVAGQFAPHSASQLAQVHGSGGIGKSLLAEEYALRFGSFWPGGIFWLRAHGTPDNPAEDHAALAQRRAHDYSRQLADFAAAHSIDPKGMDDATLHRALGHHLDAAGQPWLWIVDDLPACTRAELETWLAPSPKGLGQTLVTTRSRRLDSLGYQLPLDLLPPTDARELLTREHPPQSDEESAVAAILSRLDGHALALDIARAACRRRGYANFNRLLENPTRDALELAAQLAGELPNGHNPSIAATFLAGFADLPELGRDFLRLAAQLATAPIERELVVACFALADTLEQDTAEERADLAMQQAVDRSLAEELGNETGAGANVLVHALIGHTLRFHDSGNVRQERLREAAVQVVSGVMSRGKDIRTHRELKYAAIHAAHLAGVAATKNEFILAALIGRYDLEAARYSVARRWLEIARGGMQRLLGEEHLDTIGAESDLAATLQLQGHVAEAMARQKSVLAARLRLQGEDHPNTLESLNNLASTLKAQGDLAGALELEKSVLVTRCRVLGEDHPGNLIPMNNLAETFRLMGDHASARELHESVLAIRRRNFGDEHPDTLISMNNLALCLKGQGELHGAREIHESVLATQRRVLGEEHPSTLTSMNNLANVLLAMGDLHNALDISNKALLICRRVQGDEHPDTLTYMSNLASTLYTQGDLAGALELQKSVLATRRRVLGDEHPDTLASMNNLASTLKAQGDLAGAIELQQSALAIQRRVLGDEHPDTLTSMDNLADTLGAQGDPTSALELQKSALAIWRRVHGEEHPDTLTSMNNLASTLYAQDDPTSALELQKSALAGRRKKLGDRNPNTRLSMRNLATIHDALNNPTAAHALRDELASLDATDPTLATPTQTSGDPL